MEYFYTPPDHISGSTLDIVDDEFSHLTHVMRRKVGDTTTVVDGRGNAYDVRITTIDKHRASCEIHARHQRLHEPEVNLTLAVAVLKNASNYDFLVEKCTELGVNRIIPITTQRTIPHHARTERWQKLAFAAMKQSGRCVLPTIDSLTTLDDVLRSAPSDTLRLIPHEAISTPYLFDVTNPLAREVFICIGPEGGFSEGEIQAATHTGFQPVSLGKRRLRTETAAITAAGLTLRST